MPPLIADRLPVKIEAPDLCGRFSGRVVRGDSMDQIYPDKSVVYIAPISNVKVRNGDVVMVIRRDVAGQREATLKEYVAEGGAVWLWPRSSNPQFQAPIDYLNSANAEIEEVRIVGVVMAALTLARRP